MADYQIIERLDYTTPVTLPVISIALGTATNIVFNSVVQNNTAYTTTLQSYTGATPGTIFIFENSNRILTTVTLNTSDIGSPAAIMSKIVLAFISPSPSTLSGGEIVVQGNISSNPITVSSSTVSSIIVNTPINSAIPQNGILTVIHSSLPYVYSYTSWSGSTYYGVTPFSLIPSWTASYDGNITLTFNCLSSYITSPAMSPQVRVVPQDSTYVYPSSSFPSSTYPTIIDQDSLTSYVDRSQSNSKFQNGSYDQGIGDYVNVVNPITFLHSKMKNQFYENLMYVVQQEWQNVIDYINELKSLYNVDFYDGDNNAFLDKINNIFSLFTYSAPSIFLPYTNAENGPIQGVSTTDLTKQNDFLRNIAKRIWLQRRWAGSLNGYSLPVKLLNRNGAVHIAVAYSTTGISNTTNKIYRIMDYSQFNNIMPLVSGSQFPNSANILGVPNWSLIKSPPTTWDTLLQRADTTGLSITYSGGAGGGLSFSAVTQSGTPYQPSPRVSVPSDALGQQFSFTISGTQSSGNTGSVVINNVSISIPISTSARAVANLIQATAIPGITWLPYTGTGTITMTGSTYPAPIYWDSSKTYSNKEISLLIEVGLDRVLNFTNSIGTNVCLLDNAFLDSLSLMIPYVQKASDLVYAGSQITLLTGKDGSYNGLSGDYNYTHPNIQAKFQVLYYKPDKVSLAWQGITNLQNGGYIKIGTGGYGNSSVNNNLFVNTLASQTPSSQTVPIDLQNAIFKSYLVPAEVSSYNGYGVVNATISPRYISNVNGSNPVSSSFLINGSTLPSYPYNTYYSFPDQYISNGSVSLSLGYSTLVSPNFNANGTGVLLSATAGSTTSSLMMYTINVSNGATTGGSISLFGQSISVSASDSTSTVASNIQTYFASYGGWTATVVSNVVTMVYYLPLIQQRILVYEQYNPTLSAYDSTFKYQEINPITGVYTDIVTQSLLYGYGTDATYISPSAGYMPAIQPQVFTLLPLTISDAYPTLNSGVVARYTFDENSNTSFADSSISITTTATANGNNSSSTTNITVIPSATIAPSPATPFTSSSIVVSASPTGAPQMGQISVLYLGTYYNFTYTSWSGSTYSGVSPNPITVFGGNTLSTAATVYQGIGGGYSYSFNGTSQGNVTTSLSSTLTNLSSISVSLYYNDTSSSPVSNAVLVAKESAMSGAMGWGLYYSNTSGLGTAGILTFRYEQPSTTIPLVWTANLSNAQTQGWHNLVVSFNNNASQTLVPSIYIDGNPISITQVSPSIIFVANGTGVTLSASPIQINARVFTFNVTSGATSTSYFTINGVYVNVNAGDSSNVVAGEIASTSNTFWTATSNGTTITLTFTISIPSGAGESGLYIGGYGSHFFTGLLDEINIYSRALTSSEVQGIIASTPYKNNALLSSTGNTQYTYIDHINGFIVLKLQYNPGGPLAILAAANTSYSLQTIPILESYSVGVSNGNIAVSEMGLFDNNGTMVAYATFPPVIYNAAKHHIGFNLLVSQ